MRQYRGMGGVMTNEDGDAYWLAKTAFACAAALNDLNGTIHGRRRQSYSAPSTPTRAHPA
jgi:hypothetical protein